MVEGHYHTKTWTLTPALSQSDTINHWLAVVPSSTIGQQFAVFVSYTAAVVCSPIASNVWSTFLICIYELLCDTNMCRSYFLCGWLGRIKRNYFTWCYSRTIYPCTYYLMINTRIVVMSF